MERLDPDKLDKPDDIWAAIRTVKPAAEAEPARPTCYGDIHRASLQVGVADAGILAPLHETQLTERWEDRKRRREAETAQRPVVSPVVRIDAAGRLNKTSRERLLIAYKNGEPAERIAKRFKVNVTTARNLARKAGLPPRRGGWPAHPPALVKAVKADWNIGMLVRKIAAKHKLNPNQVTRMCAKLKRRAHWKRRQRRH